MFRNHSAAEQNKAKILVICTHAKRRSKAPSRRSNPPTGDDSADVAVTSAKPGRVERRSWLASCAPLDELSYEAFV